VTEKQPEATLCQLQKATECSQAASATTAAPCHILPQQEATVHPAVTTARIRAVCAVQVRRLAVECLQGLPPLDAVNLDTTTTASGSSSSGSNGRSLGGGGGTWAEARPAEGLLPSEYARVVAQLKKRGEKGHMILALNEVRHNGSLWF
jgi:hypothetical protein